MKNRMLPAVDEQIKRYVETHHGERPLYIILARDEAEVLMQEIKNDQRLDEKVVLTEYQGTKIVGSDALMRGDIRLTNELPETSS